MYCQILPAKGSPQFISAKISVMKPASTSNANAESCKMLLQSCMTFLGFFSVGPFLFYIQRVANMLTLRGVPTPRH